MRSRRLLGLLVTVLVLALAIPVGAAPKENRGEAQPGVDFWLTILHNNDGESQLIDLGAGYLEDFGGAARFKTIVDREKRMAVTGRPSIPGAKRGVLMVSSGDNFLAGPEFNAGLDKGIPFYDTTALDMIGYDAVAIGNHDFDFGPDVLADFLAGFSLTTPPYLSANLDFSAEPRLQAYVDAGRIAGSAIVKERGEMIGIVGATTTFLPFISSPRGVVVDAVAPAVQAEIDMLTRRGIDKIILISHLQSIQEDLDLAATLDGLDVMVAGGGDELLANDDDLLIPSFVDTDDDDIPDTFVRPTPYGPYPIVATDVDGDEIPVVTTAGNYGYLGKLVVGFDRAGDVIVIDEDSSGPIRVAGGDCGGAVPCDDAVMPDPAMQSTVIDPLVADLEEFATNVIAESEVGLNGVRGDVRTKETNEGNLIADSLLWQATEAAGDFGVDTPQVALQNGGGIRNDSVIPAGDLTELDTFSMVPFPNFVAIIEDVPREQFKEILENAVSRVEFGDGRFAQIAGFTMTWDASGTPQVLNADGTVATPGTRIVQVTLDGGIPIVSGGAVVAGDPIDVATIDFLARGGDQYPYRGLPFTSVGFTYQQALANYLVDSLGGVVTTTDYPEGGEGRITRLN